MKKPINKFAVAMWIAAVVVAIINIFQIYDAIEAFTFMAKQPGETLFVFRGFFAAISGTIVPVVLLIGFGALIEVADQIRWNIRSQK